MVQNTSENTSVLPFCIVLHLIKFYVNTFDNNNNVFSGLPFLCMQIYSGNLGSKSFSTKCY